MLNKILTKLKEIEENITKVISYHSVTQNTFFKNYEKISHLKTIRFRIRMAIAHIECAKQDINSINCNNYQI